MEWTLDTLLEHRTDLNDFSIGIDLGNDTAKVIDRVNYLMDSWVACSMLNYESGEKEKDVGG